MTGWVVPFVALAAAAVSVAAWLAGHAEGMADGTRPLAEWRGRHVDWGEGWPRQSWARVLPCS